MDASTLETLRRELEKDRAVQLDLLQEHGADPYDESVTDLQIGNDGFADSAQATEERSELLGQIEAARLRVHAIDEAFERMEEGTYGTCERCGKAIPVPRLEVRPFATRCVDCAEAD